MRISDWSSDVCSSDLEDIRVEGIAMQHHRPVQSLGGLLGTLAVALDDLGRYRRRPRLQQPGEAEADVAAADDEDALGFDLLMAEVCTRTHHVLRDRTSVVLGKCVCVRVSLGVVRICKKKKLKIRL